MWSLISSVPHRHVVLALEKILPEFAQCAPKSTRLFNFNKHAHTNTLDMPRQEAWNI